jgi:hypothetical protein
MTKLKAFTEPIPVAKFQPAAAEKAGKYDPVDVDRAPSVGALARRPVEVAGVAPKQLMMPEQLTAISPSVTL